ncbi:MAG: patatin-like phospholipase family protein [Flavobacteriales bacterium]|nr:patatin-like phospholipase family protein [Flavobacteriales bacterium]
MGEVDFKSHFLLGLACGGFIIVFNIASYISNGFRFPFIATLSKPFIKYTLNNSIIPISFIVYYVFQLVDFQLNSELESVRNIVTNVIGFLAGNCVFIILSLLYFVGTNKDIFKLFGSDLPDKKNVSNPVEGILHKHEKWYKIFNQDREWHVETYLTSPLKIALARDGKHYKRTTLAKVFSQNHINASIFEILVIATVIVIGSFRENPYFVVPAGASVMLLFSMIIMVISAVHSWVKGWSNAILFGVIILINILSQNDRFNYSNYAYGLDYHTTKAEYSNENLRRLANNDKQALADFKSGILILNNWRKNNFKKGTIKPKLIIVSTSGGGLRSALWTCKTLQYVDSLTDGQLMNNIHLFTGSSGGMIGAAYMREMYLQNETIQGNTHLDNISNDILNPIAFSMAVSDPFIRFQKFDDGNFWYTKDRGYIFEQQLNRNLNQCFRKRISEYSEPEYKAEIPMMILSPTIANDGRKLLISPQAIGYMSNTSMKAKEDNFFATDAVEFRKLLKNQSADSLRFPSALRMSATFPYVMANASLPTEPTIEIMDAGVRDNTGMFVALRYLHTFRNWINTNTSGVIVLQISDTPKDVNIKDSPYKTIFENLKGPFGGFYGNWSNMQKLNQEEIIHYSNSWFDVPFNVVDLELNHNEKNYISLSWHLTQAEKQKVLNSVDSEQNKKAFLKIQQLLD